MPSHSTATRRSLASLALLAGTAWLASSLASPFALAAPASDSVPVGKSPRDSAAFVSKLRREKYGDQLASASARRAAAGKIGTPAAHNVAQPVTAKTDSTAPAKSYITFSNPKAAEFHVNTTLPSVNFTVSESWAGNLPISSKTNESRELFFWFWPSENPAGQDDVIIWLNGGPGCSSLEGFLEENGPISYKPGASGPSPNNYSWTNVGNMLWIEQPVGVGFTLGTPDIATETALAQEFIGFLDQFYNTFDELKGKKLWITGESYAGKYIPYIANAIYKGGNQFNLQGVAFNDPSFTSEVLQEDVITAQFSQEHQQTLGFNDTFLESLVQRADQCGFTKYIEDNYNYPPKGKNGPVPSNAGNCGVFNDFYNAALDANPCFNIYRITDKCPTPNDPLGGVNGNSSTPTWFDNPNLRNAIHAPDQKWNLCTSNNVFTGPIGTGDMSPPPDSNGVVTNVIDSSPAKRTIIQHGLIDAVLFANGSKIAIQGLTWGGKQGFQAPINQTLIVDGQEAGQFTTERGLTFAQIEGSGHMIPEDKPSVGLKLCKASFLVGQVTSLSS